MLLLGCVRACARKKVMKCEEEYEADGDEEINKDEAEEEDAQKVRIMGCAPACLRVCEWCVCFLAMRMKPKKRMTLQKARIMVCLCVCTRACAFVCLRAVRVCVCVCFCEP